MSKHTAGPWVFSPDTGIVWGDQECGESEPGCAPAICRVMCENSAPLIASAPDLLDALQVISSYPEPDQLEMRIIARAAIAKVTGEAQ